MADSDKLDSEEIIDNSKGFIKSVFNFDEDSRAEMFNIVQYSLIAIIPCLIVLKSIKEFVPEPDESKGTMEISIEVIFQVILMVLALYFIDKIIKYIPTYSKVPYLGNTSITGYLLPFVFLLLTMQTKLGAKVNIIYERLMNYINPKREYLSSQQEKSKDNVSVSQPLAGGHRMSQADNPNLLPQDLSGLRNPMAGGQMEPQQSPDFNSMYQNQPTNMPGAATPGFSSEPMPANESMGNFSNW